jgi:alpha-galactosidase
MSELDLTPITCFDDAGKTAVRANQTTLGAPIVLKSVLYESGVGTHAPSKAVIELNGATSFHAIMGVNDDADNKTDHGIVDYTIQLVKDKVYTTVASGTLTRADDTVYTADITTTGYDYLVLEYATGAQAWADHCVWADARFTFTGEKPVTVSESDMYVSTDDPNVVSLPTSGQNGEEIVPLSSLEIAKSDCGWGTIQANKSIDGNAIKLKGKTYLSGVGTHGPSCIVVKLNGAVNNFHTSLGIDDEVLSYAQSQSSQGRIEYSIVLRKEDGSEKVVSSGECNAVDSDVITVDVDCQGYKYLVLTTTNGSDGQNGNDHVDWANAYFEYKEQNSTRPEIVESSVLESALNCATVMFSQPGVRFMHKIHSNNPDATFSVSNLPEGLSWNEKRNLIEGIVEKEGEYTYNVTVTNGSEVNDTPISLTVSSNLQQPTPFMGWLSWNVVQGEISETVIKTVADAFISQGLLDAGYNYLVIDDLWHASSRDSEGNPVEDSSKFPNGMKVCADYTHSKGLKFGIYSDGGTYTCAGMFGSYGYETKDANKYAEWGVDLLKYDYCNAPSDLASAKARYKAMGDALKATGRDILFYMCEWGVREPWKWGPETGASCWRATYDTRDGWTGTSGGIGMTQSVAGMRDLWPYSGVNRFNDADMMCVGIHGTGKSSSDLVSGTPGMTQDEYRSQFAMWCMWSSPLTLSFDLRKSITEDDLAIMTNTEMIAIDQDRMGQQAEFIEGEDTGCQLYAKDLENGDVAVAVINMGSAQASYTIDFSKISALDPTKEYVLRDVQNRADMDDVTDGKMNVTVRKHATVVYRLALKEKSSIANVTTSKVGDMVIAYNGDTLTVTLPASDSQKMRVLLSDLEGRVLANATTDAPTATIAVPATRGTYVVNAICGAHSYTQKVVL